MLKDNYFDKKLYFSPLKQKETEEFKETVKMHIDRGVERFDDLHISDQKKIASALLMCLPNEAISYFIFESDDSELIAEKLVEMVANKTNEKDISINDILTESAISHFEDKLNYFFYECANDSDYYDGAA